jgi:hypothetical protein
MNKKASCEGRKHFNNSEKIPMIKPDIRYMLTVGS